MCRSDTHQFGSHRPDPRILTATAFYLKLNLSDDVPAFHDNALTLVCLPRVNGCPVEVNGSMIRPDTPAYVTLYRLVNSGVDHSGTSLMFGSMERIQVGEGARFEVYIGEERLLKGVFRRGKKGEGWRVECTSLLEREVTGIEEVEVCVVGNGGTMKDKVVAAKRRTRRRRRHRGCLEEIPEEEEEEEEEDMWNDGELSCSSSCECESGSEDGDRTAVEEMEMEYEMEGVRWAVDVGIMVVCLGVGYLVSRASSKTLRRRKFLV